VIYAAIKRAKGEWDKPVGAHDRFEGAELVSNVTLVDQTPIGRTPRSNPVTYLKAFDPIRELFSNTKDARANALTASPSWVAVSAGDSEEGRVAIVVEDHGKGLELSLQNTAGDGVVDSEHGLGVGLFLSNATIQRHGGTLKARADRTGTTMIIDLPQAQAHTQGDKEAE